MEILRAYRRKIMGLPGGASPNIREWRKLLKLFFAHTELTEHFKLRGLPEKENYRWPIDKDYGRAFVLFELGARSPRRRRRARHLGRTRPGFAVELATRGTTRGATDELLGLEITEGVEP